MAIVLVVDDEALVRMYATDLAQELGYEVVEANSADAAIRILESRDDVRIVFSDCQMPGTMDGVRLMQIIRDRWPPIALVLTSGKSLLSGTSLPEGTIFVPKPYSVENVADAFGKALAAS